MASLRHIAACIGISGNFAVVRDFYGYATGAPTPLSLLTQIKLLQGKHIHLNLIRVGIESFTFALEQNIDAAVQITRGIYAAINLGIGRVERYYIPTAKANGHEVITSNCEAEELMEEWTVPNDALDVFFVLDYNVPSNSDQIAGYSGIDEDCEKEGALSGSVVTTEFSPSSTGFFLAHEIGHYLGVTGDYDESLFEILFGEGPDLSDNLMYFKGPNKGIILPNEAADMKDHCFVKPGCP